MSPPHIIIATHHKSGTVWMMTTFIRIAQANGWLFDHLNADEDAWHIAPNRQQRFDARLAAHRADNPEQRVVFFDYHGVIPDLTGCKQTPGVRGLHIIRDPRDMLLSAVRFHLKGNEPWLDVPDPKWGGQSFRQKLSGYASLEDQLAFEMDTHMGWSIEQMANLGRQGVILDIKYEELIEDHDMRRFHAALVHLGVSGHDLINALDAYWRSSLFGERSEADIRATSGHIFESSAMQWQSALDDQCIHRIEERFGWAIEKLGYPLVD